jgi:SAM-dependent methyltransferase
MNNFVKSSNNPHLKVLQINFEQLAFYYIEQVKKQLNITTVDLLDIGGGRGWGKCLFNRKDVNYHALDLN